MNHVINWTHNNKTVALAINLDTYKAVHYLEGEIERNNVVPFPKGVFCNPKLDKKQYLKLVRAYHPDVCTVVDTKTATQIAQVINATKDGNAPRTSYANNSQGVDWEELKRQARERYSPEFKCTLDELLDAIRPQDKWVVEAFGRTGYTFCYEYGFPTAVKIVEVEGLTVKVSILSYARHGRDIQVNTYAVVTHVSSIAIANPRLRLDYFTAKDLKEFCKQSGVGTSGTKQVLIDRLRSANNSGRGWKVHLTSPCKWFPIEGYDKQHDEIQRMEKERVEKVERLQRDKFVSIATVVKRYIERPLFIELYKKCAQECDRLGIKPKTDTNPDGREFNLYPKTLIEEVWAEMQKGT